MTRTRHPPGLSDSSLMALWRKAVLAHYGHRCVICGGGGTLEAHHLVHRGQSKWLRFDWKNGVPVHHGECHAIANAQGIYAAPENEHVDYLRGAMLVTFKQHLAEQRLSDAEFRGQTKAALLAELARCEVAHG